jgi:hypothetical protein
MAEFETLKSEKIEWNQGGEFLELSINVARDGTRETRYLRLARGYYGSDGEPRYKKGGTTLPGDPEVLGRLAEALKTFDLSELKK